MPNIRLSIPSLIGGVSQQPPELRYPNQAEQMDNVLVSVERGVEKRPGTLAILDAATADGSLNVTSPANEKYVHWIERDSQERYLILVDPANLDAECVEAFDLSDASKCTVGGISASEASYLKSGTLPAKSRYLVETVADATFIVNKEVTTALKGAATTYTGASGNLRNSSDPRNVNDFTEFDQPPTALSQYWYAQDLAVGYPGGFYQSISTSQAPWYTRVRTEGANSEIDETTFPLRLDNTAPKNFSLNVPAWTSRLSGDSDTNPGPSLIGKKIRAMALWQGRLWFGGGEQLVSSQAGDLFNLWLDDWTNVNDVDPIDITVSGGRLSNIEHVVPFSKSLVVLTDGARQFELRGLEVVSPSTANLIQSTAYRTNATRPESLASQLYFAARNGEFGQIYEYLYDEDQIAQTATDITVSVHEYIPSDIDEIVAAPNDDMLLLRCGSQPNIVYVYSAHWSGDQKAMSAWYRWVFAADTSVISMFVFDSTLYLLVRRGGKMWLESMEVSRPVVDPLRGLHVHMDRRMSVLGVYDAATNKTTWTTKMVDTAINTAFTQDSRILPVKNNGDGTYEVAGNYSASAVILGRNFDMTIVMSRMFRRDESNLPVMGRLMLRKLIVRHAESSYYRVVATPSDREDILAEFTGASLGGVVIGGDRREETGEFTARIMGDSERMTIKIINDLPVPSRFTTMEVLANFIPLKRGSNRG